MCQDPLRMSHSPTPSHRPRSRLRRAIPLAAGAAAVVLALTGCLKVDMAVNVRSDDKVDGSVLMAVDKSLLSMGGQSPEDAFKEFSGEGPFPTAPASGSVSTEVYDQDGKYGQRYTFSDVPVSEFDNEDFKIARDGEFFVVDGNLDLSEVSANSDTSNSDDSNPDNGNPDNGNSELGDLSGLGDALAAGFDIRVAVTFPGEVVEHNGTLEGTTVVWTPKAGENLAIKAKAKAEGAGGAGSTLLVPLVIGGVVLVLLVVGAIVLLARRKSPTPAVVGAAGAAGPPVGGAGPAGGGTPPAATPPTTPPTEPPA